MSEEKMATEGMDSAETDMERRKRQRFVARRWGDICFWIHVGAMRLPVHNLSLEGFSVPLAQALPMGQHFAFRLEMVGEEGEVSGMASPRNFFMTPEGSEQGCRMESLSGEARALLHAWLIRHVMATTTLPLSEEEAAQIVSGPSII
jgi:hypothetical protein